MLKVVCENEFDIVFGIMENSFPADEYRSYNAQKDLLNEEKYSLFCMKIEGLICAFVAIWEFDDFVFVEHIAVKSDMRGKGFGSDILSELKKKYNKPICLEVEPPLDEITSKRINFYQNNGFYLNEYDYVQPAMDFGKKPIPLMIMSSGGYIDKKYFEHVKNVLYSNVYKIGE